jgi:uncharacterized protein (TIGR03083 family)
MDVVARTAANRRLLADFFDGLDDAELDSPSLCDAWSVREVLGHLVMPLEVGMGEFARHVVRSRGSLDRANRSLASHLAARPVGELTTILRDKAHERVPRPMGQLADTCIHLRDCARPLGRPDDVALDDWRAVLDWLTTSRAAGFVPRGRLDGLALRSVDQDWSWGTGQEVSGTSEALAMAVTGRESALDALVGPGAEVLRARVARRAG